MNGLNQDHEKTTRYSARATGTLSTDPSGAFVEKFGWSDLMVNGNAVTLSPDVTNWREILSLDPKVTLTVPDLSKVPPALIAPITDLLTFYADLQLAGHMGDLKKPGDHTYFKHGSPNSWADGAYFLLGEDSIDFDLTFKALDPEKNLATLAIRHVPPAKPQVKLPAEWMRPRLPIPKTTGSKLQSRATRNTSQMWAKSLLKWR